MDPNLNLEKSTPEEDALIMEAVKIHGTKWTAIAETWTPPGERTSAYVAKVPPHQRAGLLIARPQP